MLHIGSSIRHPLGMCLLDTTHILSTKHLRLAVMGSMSSIRLSSIPVCFHKVETLSERYSLWYYDWVDAITDWGSNVCVE